MEYLRQILPAESPDRYYCAAKLLPPGSPAPFANYFFSDLDRLHAFLQAHDAAGETMYVAQAAFDRAAVDAAKAFNAALPPEAPKGSRKGRRIQAHAVLLRSFFMDIDCGEKKDYTDQREALFAFRDFCLEAGLPAGTVESSGNGLYARWVLTEDLDAGRWTVAARHLKDLASQVGFKFDPVRTADSASVLRAVGTHNRKRGEEKLVRVVLEAPAVSFDVFAAALAKALGKQKLDNHRLLPPGEFKGLNDDFASGIGDCPDSDINRVLERCNAVKNFFLQKGNVPEPVWYNMVGLLRFCVEGEETLQEWSSGHPEYSPAATADKIEHHRQSGVGPTTCQKIGDTNPAPCIACPHKVKSPIVLGYPAPTPVEMTEEEAELLPSGWVRSKEGLDSPEGLRFYAYDLYVRNLSFDETLGYEVMTIRHALPHNGYRDFSVRSALIHKPTDLLMALTDHHVQPATGDNRKIMMGYLNDYMATLRAKKRLDTLHPQMGWSKDGDDLVFVLGAEVFRKGEEPVEAGLARSAPEVAKAFGAVGSVAAWREATAVLAQPGMEALAFPFLASAFGAPLMYFTGHSGAMVSMVGKSGLGKTMTGKWALSAYGDPDLLMLQKDDTPASMIGRLGTYGSLPAYIDEISNMDPQTLSDLVYRVTQGRERNRLTQRGEEKSGRTSWRTLAVCSSNHPLADRLSSLKTDASAEINRILEIHVTTPKTLTASVCRGIFKAFTANHGGPGREYVRYLVEHQAEHREKLEQLIQLFEERTRAKGEERFWIAIAAVTVYGGLIARKLGLVDIEVSKLVEWVARLIREQRSGKKEMVTTDVDIIGQFLDKNAAGGLVTGRDALNGVSTILREPRGAVVYRIMHDQSRLFISRTALKTFLAENYASYSELKKEMLEIGALVDSDKRKTLGAGTYFAGVSTPCWEMDLTVPALGRQVVRLVEKSDTAMQSQGGK